MATATIQTKKFITCDICVKPVQQFCNSCQVGLCEDCINKHVNSLKSMKHNIVPFTDCTVQLVFPQCTSHSHQRCETHCQQCDVPVCIKCLTGQHKGHDIVDTSDIVASKRGKIKEETEEIEGIIQKNTAQDIDTENKISKSTAHYADLQKQTNDHRKQWRLEVDNIFNKIGSLTMSLRDHHITSLKSCQSELRHQNSSINQCVQENKDLLKSNIVSDVNNSCVGSDKVWINGLDKVITFVDIQGAVQDIVTSTCVECPGDIAVTLQKELIYSDAISRTVNIVRDGKTETLITTPEGWHPSGLCCTRSGDILVSMCTTDYNYRKIVRYQGQRVIQEIDKDEHGGPIYQGGRYRVCVVENNNGDIVASDMNVDTVVVVERTGKVRFRYNDKPPGGKKPFSPRQIVTDSMGHIIVTDLMNNCIHFLDHNGQIMKFASNINCGIYFPVIGLSVDSEGRLWVGLHLSGEVKVIEYMK
ncbi:tripartite motif-containing protein 2-like [Saccostrea echinata]|uniref:tripartite motif-containing protein 2-like n=1 Tax=Saccostrea echinata TaxID=191078 RepID=UPI002A820E23|nr:tripartite motif-containing protein 2-like [Saccostrea echinata]